MNSPTVPQSNPKAGYLAHATAIDAAVHRCLESGWYILGAEVRGFEQEFAAWLGIPNAFGVANGTDALVVALRALEIGPGDLVFTVSHTAVATVAAIELAGATPVLVDIDPVRFTMCPESLRRAVAATRDGKLGRPKAVIAVHLYGQAADLEAIQEITRANGLSLIEDCAQCHGAKWRGQTTGTLGDIAAFSFYPTKNLGALGDGGAVVTRRSDLAERIRLIREYGWKERYISLIPGLNSRLDELQAVILRVFLGGLTASNFRRGEIACEYSGLLQHASVAKPVVAAGCHHVFHQYVVRTRGRDALKAHLTANGVGSLIHYPVPVHRQPAYAGRVTTTPGGLPETERAAAEVLSLPMFPQLTGEQVRKVAAAVNEWKA